MAFQQVIALPPQQSMAFAEPPPALAFPLSLAEHYQPKRIADFIGIERPRNLLSNLASSPRPCSLLFIGPPGVGKSTIALTFAEEAGLSLKPIPAQKCDVLTLDAMSEKLAYSPPRGRFWVVLVDEADQMTEKAQLQLLSKMDATARLKPCGFGGAMELGSAPPIIWIFTCNGRGPAGLEPPDSLLPRFRTRCMTVEFPAVRKETLASFLQTIWRKERGPKPPKGYFEYIATGDGVRDSLMMLDADLLAGVPRDVPALCACGRYLRAGEIEKCSVCLTPKAKVVSISASSRSAAAIKAWETRRKNDDAKRASRVGKTTRSRIR